MAPFILTCDKLMLVGCQTSDKFLDVTYRNSFWAWNVGAIFGCHIPYTIYWSCVSQLVENLWILTCISTDLHSVPVTKCEYRYKFDKHDGKMITKLISTGRLEKYYLWVIFCDIGYCCKIYRLRKIQNISRFYLPLCYFTMLYHMLNLYDILW